MMIPRRRRDARGIVPVVTPLERRDVPGGAGDLTMGAVNHAAPTVLSPLLAPDRDPMLVPPPSSVGG
jgi:hypothetical protein